MRDHPFPSDTLECCTPKMAAGVAHPEAAAGWLAHTVLCPELPGCWPTCCHYHCISAKHHSSIHGAADEAGLRAGCSLPRPRPPPCPLGRQRLRVGRGWWSLGNQEAQSFQPLVKASLQREAALKQITAPRRTASSDIVLNRCLPSAQQQRATPAAGGLGVRYAAASLVPC